jgi:hypothetical protein
VSGNHTESSQVYPHYTAHCTALMCTSHSEAYSCNERLQLCVLVDLISGCLLDVKDLASQRENGLRGGREMERENEKGQGNGKDEG